MGHHKQIKLENQSMVLLGVTLVVNVAIVCIVSYMDVSECKTNEEMVSKPHATKLEILGRKEYDVVKFENVVL